MYKMTVFINIGALCGVRLDNKPRLQGEEMSEYTILRDAWMAVDANGNIHSFGDKTHCPTSASEVIDLKGGWVFPSFCDSHTHIVYAGNRAGEFLDKINGLSYEEIGRRGGGILNSADLLHATSESDLYEQAMERVNEMIAKGTGAIEIKSGYGLTTDDELKMLRVIRRIKQTTPALVKSTFLGAHAVGRAYSGRQTDYVDLVCNEMIPMVGRQGLADYIDVFCDTGYFTPDETARILEVGYKYGLKPKIHADELAASGGTKVGVDHGALSVDHLERAGATEIELLKGSKTMPTALPGASFFSCLPFAPAKEMIAAGLGVALASDYNPGSSPSGDMRFVCSLGSIRMKLTPQQALNAATVNSAYAMGLSDKCGSITPGKIANFFVTAPLPSLEYLLYAYTTPLIDRIFLRGEEIC